MIESFLDKAKAMYGDTFCFPNIDAEYKNNKSKITVKCNKCGYVFQKRPNDFLGKTFHGCKHCNEIAKFSITYDRLSELAKGNKIKAFEGTKDTRKDSVIAICEKHGEYLTPISSVLKNKYGCRKCNMETAQKVHKLTADDFDKRLKERYSDLITPFLDEYRDTSTSMSFQCNTCGHIFKRTPNSFLFSNLRNPCPRCSKEEQTREKTKTTEQFIKDAISVWGNDKFDFSETVYTKSDKKVRIRCNECGRTFEIEANSFLSGLHGCPYHFCNASKKEKEISEFLTSIGVYNLTNDRTALQGKELDIWISENNIAIEFDGIFWHNELYKDKDYHLLKTKECEEQGIRLIHIFEDEWIYKKDIWNSMLRNMFGKNENRIFARKCKIREVDSIDACKFLEENHIQGKCGSAVRYGLYYDDELVSLMTFGKTRHFIGSSTHEWELLRFCNKTNTSVVGAASRLFKHFVGEHKPSSVVSYADRRWSTGKLYDTLGFTLYNISRPNYFYVVDNRRRNRFNFRKSILMEKYNCPIGMSEREFCKSQKWWRIYDCGALCYEWKF